MGDEQKSPKLHEDHRQRMKNRLANNADSLSRHELLEILLFYAIPRKNVNPLSADSLRITRGGSFSI